MLGNAAVAAVLVAIAVPVLAVAWRAMHPGGELGPDAVVRILGSPRTWRIVALTVGQAVASAALTVAVGVPVAWVLSRYRFVGSGALRTLAIVPFVLPSVVIGTAFASLMGPQGLVDARGTWWPILAAHVCFNLAVVLRTVGAAFEGVDRDLESAARTLGSSTLGAAARVTAPIVAPAIAAATVVVFLFSLTSFGVIVILGGGAVTTVEVEIWTRSTRQFDLSGAGVLCLVQLLAVVAALALHARIARRQRPVASTGAQLRPRRPRGVAQRAAALACTAVVLVVSLLPLLALVERSLRVPGGWGLAHWRSLGSATAGTALAVSPLDAVVASLSIGSLAAVVAVLAGVASARVAVRRPGGMADRVLLLPLGVSATTIGLGMLLAYGRPPVDLRRSWWLVPAAQALVALPLVVRSVLPALRSLSGELSEAAATLGASGTQRWWRVELPLVRPALVAGAGLALVACLGEFGATVFLARADRATVPVAIEQLMSRPGGAGFGQAMALSCVLAALCAGVVALVDRQLGPSRGAALNF